MAQSPAETPGFDVSALDRNADPCGDFYQFACGNWLKSNPVPADQSTWGRFHELMERNRIVLKDILDKSSADDPKRTAVEQKIGDYYAACMDEPAINQKGLKPLKEDLDRIAALSGKQDLPDALIKLHRIGASALFSFRSEQDFKDSTQMIAAADQGGMGLPDRDYYFKEDAKSQQIRSQYVEHVAKILALAGDSAEQASAGAKAVMEIETGLAKGALDRTSRRDPQKVYHKMTVKELAALAPSFPWDRYLTGIGGPKVEALNVTEPAFFQQIEKLLSSTSLNDWKTYLRWHLLHNNAALLSTGFVDENFAFYGKTLTGAKELRPRWKRCVDLADNELSEALGQKFVEKTFGEAGKKRTLTMVAALEKALAADIEALPWMTPTTKKQALGKLQAITNKIGYPDKWRDYSRLQIQRGDLLGNSKRASEFEFLRQLDKIGKPIDPGEWFMSPPTVNAYYDPQMNNINFPAGILQPPFFDNRLDDAVNFGGIGAVIGHELTHGFDDQGRQFDAKGNLRDWWTEQDAQEFEKRSSCFVDQFAAYETIPGVKLNGKLTLGENVADNGGLRIAHMALMDSLTRKRTAKIDGFTPEQRIFLGWGQIWCQNTTEQAARLRAAVDPHSPPRYRVNGVVTNMPEFQKAFACRAGQPMVREKACRVW